MTKSAARWNLLFRDIFVLLLTFAVIEGFNIYFDLQASVYFILVAEIILIAAITLIDHFKGKPILWIVLGGVIVVGLAAVHYFVKPLNEVYEITAKWIEKVINWFISYINQPEEPKLIQVELYYVLAMVSAAIFVCVLVLYPMSWNTITRCITALLVLGGLITLAVLKIPVNKASIFCAYMCIASALVELCNLQFERSRINKKTNASLFLYPVCLFIAVAAIIFPTKEDPIRWQKIRDAYDKLSIDTQSAVDTMKIIFRVVPDQFTIGNDGTVFVGRKKTIDATEYTKLAYIDVVGGTDSNLYMRGSTSSTYTGRGWTDESKGVFPENEPSVETYEIMYAMLRDGLMPEPDEDLFRKVKINVDFNRLITKSLFYSPMTTNIKVQNEKDKYAIQSSNILFNRMKKIGYSYTYDYYETNWGSETMANYLRSLDGYEYDNEHIIFATLKREKGSAYSEIYNTYGNLDTTEFDYRLARSLPERADAIDSLYGALPEDLPESVYAFAEEITKDCPTEYDKIVAIEKYFSENYSYALSADKQPRDRDFVDWFVHDQTSGYCTHFATASAVLCRCLGIPARYVEGFMINEALDSVREMPITSEDAHAWCEVYIEGFGWMVMESTPGYGVGRNTEWARKKLSTNTAPVDDGLSELEKQMLKEAEMAQMEQQVPEVEPLTPEQLAALKAERKAASRKFWLYTSSITTGVLVIAFVAFVLAARRRKAKRYNRAGNNDKIRILMGELLLLAEISDKKMEPSDTLNEFISTLDDRYDTHDLKLRGAADMFQKVRYSSYEANRYEVLNMYRYTREVRRNILRKQNVFKRLQYSAKLYL